MTSFLVIVLALSTAYEMAGQGPVQACPRPLGLLRPPGTEKVALATSNLGPLPAESVPDGDVIRVDTKLVVTEFDVRDKKGRPVLGLNGSDFKIEEDGVEQKIEIFSFGKASARISRSVLLIIDYSQSQAPYIEASIEAAKVLVDLLEPHDRMAIVTDDVELIAGFTSDKAGLRERLDRLKARSREGQYGRSLQLSALNASVAELFDFGDKRPIVILQTDGDEYAPLALLREPPQRGRCEGMLRNFSELEKALETAGTTVYSVIPGVAAGGPKMLGGSGAEPQGLERTVKGEARHRLAALNGPMRQFAVNNWVKGRLRDAKAVERLSALTGGTSQFLDRPENAGTIYRRILDEMNNRYLLGYYPGDDSTDARSRSIKVTLRNYSGFNVKGRTSYIPRK